MVVKAHLFHKNIAGTGDQDLSGEKYPGLARSGIYILIFILSALFVIYCLSDPNLTWVHPEAVSRHLPFALGNRHDLVAEDLLRGFDFWSFDGAMRTRFLSYVGTVVDLKFRNWFFQHFPPLLSLSLTWIFSLLLSPLFLWKLIYNLSRNRISAWMGISLYYLSTGFLSGIVMFFHPGKPLCRFAAIFCLYCASVIVPCRGNDREGKNTGWFWLLVLSVFISFFLEETFWFIFIAIPVLFPALLFSRPPRWWRIFAYGLLPVIFVLFVTWLAPRIIENLGFGNFNFWQCELHPFGASEYRVWEKFIPLNILINARNILFDYISIRSSSGDLEISALSVLIPLFFGGYFLLMFFRASSARKKIIARVFLVIILFLIFETMLFTKKGIVQSSYYYGTLFPVFWVLLVSLILSSGQERYRPIGLIIFIFLLLLGGYNFIVLGRSWYLDHGRPIGALYPDTARVENDGIELTREMVMNIWKNRDQPGVLEELRKNYPRRSYWFFAEMEYSWLFRVIDRLEKEAGAAQPIQASDQIISEKKPGNLLSARDVRLRVSDQNGPGQGAENLIDGDYDTVWHIRDLVDFVTRPSWLEVDLGPEKAARVRTVAALPAPSNPQAFIKRGLLLGSRDRVNWEPVSLLEGPRNPNLNQWIYWNIAPDRSYRFYKLYLVNNPDNSRDYFLALSELGFYE